MKIERFEDLEVWNDARRLANLVYELTKKRDFAKDYGLRDQMRRAAVSIMSIGGNELIIIQERCNHDDSRKIL